MPWVLYRDVLYDSKGASPSAPTACSSGKLTPLQHLPTLIPAPVTPQYHPLLLAPLRLQESMSKSPMKWEGSENPKLEENPEAKDGLIPMGEPLPRRACPLYPSDAADESRGADR